jgi:hypothetical protein
VLCPVALALPNTKRAPKLTGKIYLIRHGKQGEFEHFVSYFQHKTEFELVQINAHDTM